MKSSCKQNYQNSLNCAFELKNTILLLGVFANTQRHEERRMETELRIKPVWADMERNSFQQEREWVSSIDVLMYLAESNWFVHWLWSQPSSWFNQHTK